MAAEIDWRDIHIIGQVIFCYPHGDWMKGGQGRGRGDQGKEGIIRKAPTLGMAKFHGKKSLVQYILLICLMKFVVKGVYCAKSTSRDYESSSASQYL